MSDYEWSREAWGFDKFWMYCEREKGLMVQFKINMEIGESSSRNSRADGLFKWSWLLRRTIWK